MSKIVFLTLFTFFCIIPSFAQADEIRIKDGRQYLAELTRRLTLAQDVTVRDELAKLFGELRQNLPKENNFTNIYSSLDTMAKIAVEACRYASYWEQDWTNIDGLYQTMLDRSPTDNEIKTAILDDSGKLSYLPNCIYLALHPEFITRRQ